MNQVLPIENLNQLLNDNSDSVIWSQNIRSSITVGRKIFHVVLLMGFIIFALVALFTKNAIDVSVGFDAIAILITYGLLLSYEITKTYIFATLEYSIYPKHITFEWGFFKPKRVDIPFSDIIAINLVQYNNNDISTIHFGTNNVYDIKKLDFDNNDTRPHITFERVQNGVKVYELLSLLQKEAKKR